MLAYRVANYQICSSVSFTPINNRCPCVPAMCLIITSGLYSILIFKRFPELTDSEVLRSPEGKSFFRHVSQPDGRFCMKIFTMRVLTFHGTTTTSPLFRIIFWSRFSPFSMSPYRNGMALSLPSFLRSIFILFSAAYGVIPPATLKA